MIVVEWIEIELPMYAFILFFGHLHHNNIMIHPLHSCENFVVIQG